MRTLETADGNYTVRHVPLLHWFVVIALMLIGGTIHIYGGPWWCQLIFGLVVLMMLIRNSSFSISTNFSCSEGKVRTEHRGLFGTKRREIDFSTVKKVEFNIERWGRHRAAPRTNLTLWFLDEEMNSDCVEIFVSANPDKGRGAADRICEILTPHLAPEIPQTAPMPPWFGADGPSRLFELCRRHSCENCLFVRPEDMEECQRETIDRELALPSNESIVAFHDLTKKANAKRGIAVGCGGLYWKNRAFTASKNTWVSWERFVDSEVSIDRADADVWIAPSMQLGLNDTSQQRTIYELLLAIQNELRRMRDEHTGLMSQSPIELRH